MLLLSVWSGERFPVGRPKSVKYNLWDDNGDPLRRPTWAYKWDVVSESSSDTTILYKQYTNEFDALTLTPEQVAWEPYGSRDNFAENFDLIRSAWKKTICGPCGAH